MSSANEYMYEHRIKCQRTLFIIGFGFFLSFFFCDRHLRVILCPFHSESLNTELAERCLQSAVRMYALMRAFLRRWWWRWSSEICEHLSSSPLRETMNLKLKQQPCFLLIPASTSVYRPREEHLKSNPAKPHSKSRIRKQWKCGK